MTVLDVVEMAPGRLMRTGNAKYSPKSQIAALNSRMPHHKGTKDTKHGMVGKGEEPSSPTLRPFVSFVPFW